MRTSITLGGLQHFPDAEGFVGEGEFRYAHTPENHVAAFFRDQDLEAAGNIHWNELPAGYDHDIFGDGSVIMISFPGHTPGALGLRLNFEDRSLLLSGDSAHLHENVEQLIGMPLDADSVGKVSSMRRLKLLGTQPNTTVWVNHDPQDWAENRASGKQVV
jgi:glyoxylase-like metal-dependent hydrolase (beta-lactamase superfamily II)